MIVKSHSIEDEAVAADAVDMGTLINENRSLQEENKSLQDRLLRALADSENARRQADRTISEARQYCISDFARELLPVVDNLQRSLEAAERHPASADNPALLQGVSATLRAFLRSLEEFGVRPIEALGKAFDPNFHEAVAMTADPSNPPGTVTEVVEPGYTIRDRLLRPARVVVSKEPEQAAKQPALAPSEPDDQDLGSMWGGNSR